MQSLRPLPERLAFMRSFSQKETQHRWETAKDKRSKLLWLTIFEEGSILVTYKKAMAKTMPYKGFEDNFEFLLPKILIRS